MGDIEYSELIEKINSGYMIGPFVIEKNVKVLVDIIDDKKIRIKYSNINKSKYTEYRSSFEYILSLPEDADTDSIRSEKVHGIEFILYLEKRKPTIKHIEINI